MMAFLRDKNLITKSDDDFVLMAKKVKEKLGSQSTKFLSNKLAKDKKIKRSLISICKSIMDK